MIQEILQTRFGFDRFRPRQEAVCRSVAEGSDALVVMPTGAGKSLCYQVPGLARGGTTLVISPLVALIEDQVGRLLQRGIRAGRIHSGRSRDDSRETFRAYLRGELEFLFIAPERLAVPGFAEMLQKHPPSLIAVDEAHCISHWGHDFRPDYRLVGERLAGLGDTPKIALTATATAIVQKDICAQLKLREPKLFIHGFRRENLAIRLSENLPSERLDAAIEILGGEGRLPAIVYAPTRKKAEEFAAGLGRKFRSAAYHAGMPAADREKVQRVFLEGKLDAIVATVAFGMGIDKADVRTIVHVALPGSVEGYYQEIGRAGRDGLPAEAVLLHSFSDRKTHEFFLDRDHPDTEVLAKIRAAVPETGSIPRVDLQARCESIESDVFEKALEKLWIHEGIRVDPEENVAAGTGQWRKPYEDLRRHRHRQLDSIQAYTSGSACRMLQLIRHFGDEDDASQPCGICDRCRPSADARLFSSLERSVGALVLASLGARDGQAVGRLFEEASGFDRSINRSGFERVLSALGRAGFLEQTQTEFEKDGKTISFRRVSLLSKGRHASADDLASVEIDGAPMGAGGGAARKPRPRKVRAERPARGADASADPSAPSEAPPFFEALRAWRLGEARAKGVPAFRVLSDRVLYAICENRPDSEAALLQVPGLGPKLVRKYGAEILGILS